MLQTIHVLNKEIFRFLGLNSAVYNRERVIMARVRYFQFPDFLFVWNVLYAVKGQLISKCLFSVFNSSKKQTKTVQLEVPYVVKVSKSRLLSRNFSQKLNETHSGYYPDSWVCFVRFLGEITDLQFCFQIDWPLVTLNSFIHFLEELKICTKKTFWPL